MTDVEKQIFAKLRKVYAEAPDFLAAIDATEREIMEMRENSQNMANAEGGYTGDFAQGYALFHFLVCLKIAEDS